MVKIFKAAKDAARRMTAACLAAADVKAYTELAESHGHMITATEPEERLRWELEFADQPERWMGCGDAASPQGKQHRLRSRTKKKKKKKKR